MTKKLFLFLTFFIPFFHDVHFTIITQAEEGTLPKETLSTLKMVEGVRFDEKNKRLLFPLSEHDKLAVALSSILIRTELLPRNVIAAAQLSYRRDNPSRIMNIDNDDESD